MPCQTAPVMISMKLETFFMLLINDRIIYYGTDRLLNPFSHQVLRNIFLFLISNIILLTIMRFIG